MAIPDKQFSQSKKRYLFQCMIGLIYIFLVLLVLGAYAKKDVLEAIGMGALGSTLFLVLAAPDSVMASWKNIIGGYFIAIALGIIGHYCKVSFPILHSFFPLTFDDALYCALAFGIAMLMMTVMDVEHPPAGGLAVALVLENWNFSILLVVLGGAVGIILLKAVLRKHLINLI